MRWSCWPTLLAPATRTPRDSADEISRGNQRRWNNHRWWNSSYRGVSSDWVRKQQVVGSVIVFLTQKVGSAGFWRGLDSLTSMLKTADIVGLLEGSSWTHSKAMWMHFNISSEWTDSPRLGSMNSKDWPEDHRLHALFFHDRTKLNQ